MQNVTRLNFSAEQVKRLYFLLLAGDLLLAAAYGLFQFVHMPRAMVADAFDLDGEATLPAWYTSVQFFFIGLVFLFVWSQWRRSRNIPQWVLAGAGLGFLFLSADESASIHERITTMTVRLEWLPRFEGGHGVWVYVYGAAGIILALIMARHAAQIYRQFRRPTLIMAAGGCLFLAGAVGLEVVSYEYLRGDDALQRLYALEVLGEELLEMVGVTTVLYGACLFAREYGSPPVAASSRPPAQAYAPPMRHREATTIAARAVPAATTPQPR